MKYIPIYFNKAKAFLENFSESGWFSNFILLLGEKMQGEIGIRM